MIDRGPARLAALLVTLTFIVGAAACGDADDDGSSGNANAAQDGRGSNEPGQPQAAASAETEIAALMQRLRQSYNNTDGKAFCADLTSNGVREMNDWAATVAKFPDNCPAFIGAYAALFVSNDSPQTPVRVKKVTVDGDRGTVKMRGGLAGIRSTATYKVARVGGNWKLTNPVSGAETRRIEQ